MFVPELGDLFNDRIILVLFMLERLVELSYLFFGFFTKILSFLLGRLERLQVTLQKLNLLFKLLFFEVQFFDLNVKLGLLVGFFRLFVQLGDFFVSLLLMLFNQVVLDVFFPLVLGFVVV